MQAPVARLPDELLSEICVHCLPETPSFRSHCAPALLTQVCSRWRQVALKTSEMWANIHLNHEDLNRKALLPLIELWLERSNGQLIDVFVDMIWVDMTSRNIYERRELYLSIMAVIRPHRHRILRLNGVFPQSVAGCLPFSEMGSLESLRLKGFRDGIGNLTVMPINLPTHLPQLHTISFTGLSLNMHSIHRQTQLTHLSLNPLSVEEAYTLLSALPLLEIVDFKLNQDGGYHAVVGRIQLPALKALHICSLADSKADPHDIFDSFAAPNIGKLVLAGLMEISPDDFWSSNIHWDALYRFVQASGARYLRELRLICTADIDCSFLDILRTASNITTLESTLGPVNELSLCALVWDENDPAHQLIPQLDILKLSHIPDFEREDILPFLSTRKHVLKEVTLGGCRPIEEEIMDLGIPVVEFL